VWWLRKDCAGVSPRPAAVMEYLCFAAAGYMTALGDTAWQQINAKL